MSAKLTGNTSVVLMTKVIPSDAQTRSLHTTSPVQSQIMFDIQMKKRGNSVFVPQQNLCKSTPRKHLGFVVLSGCASLCPNTFVFLGQCPLQTALILSGWEHPDALISPPPAHSPVILGYFIQVNPNEDELMITK